MVDGISNMIKSETEIDIVFGGLGITNNTLVVIYDDGWGLYSARLFWAMDYYGHENVGILNGGYGGWIEGGYDTDDNIPVITKTGFQAEKDGAKIATSEWIQANLDNPDVKILDVRSEKEFIGESLFSDRGGHIPGAVNLEWKRSLEDGSTVFRSAEELIETFQMHGITADKEIVVHCQTGIRGAHSYFTLRLLGYQNVRLYDGSWAEWGNNPELLKEPEVTDGELLNFIEVWRSDLLSDSELLSYIAAWAGRKP